MPKEQKGDFPTFLESHKGIVFKVCQTYCQQAVERKDLAQEIIIQLWKAFPRYDPAYKASTWVYRIALNVAISYHRKLVKRRESPADLNLVSFHPGQQEEDPRLHLIYELIYQLDDLNKAIILLYLEDYNYKEVAAVVGLTETNVASKINRIKKKLKKLAQQTINEPKKDNQ
jgi:RNA polymerase sigma-70 factor (ECF subfamily)